MELSRRNFLKTGVSFAASLSLGKILGSAPLAQAAGFTVQKKLIWISLNGGWDILESVDPKETSTAGIQLAYDYSQAHEIASGVKIGRWLPKIAAYGSDVTVVRGIAMGTTSHEAGYLYMDTGILSNAGRVNAASIPSIVASESQATIPIIQLSGGSEPLIDRGLLAPISVVRASNLELYRSMYPTDSTQIARRIEMLDYLKKSLETATSEMTTNDRLTALQSAEQKIRAQFENDVGSKLRVSDAELAPYTSAFSTNSNYRNAASSFALATKLIRNDLVTTVNIGLGGFDTHTNQDAALEPLLGAVDHLVATLIGELKSSKLLDGTLIVLWSDFGRTPRINGSSGRDHWPVGGSMLIGGGLKGGRVVGGSDDSLRALSINPDTGAFDTSGTQITPIHIGGTVLKHCLGADYMRYRPYLESLNILAQTK